MSIGSVGIAASLAGTRLAQSQAAEAKSAADATPLNRVAAATHSAEAAAGIAPQEHELTTADRDGDGRQAWQFRDGMESPEEEAEASESASRGIDLQGDCGTQLDVSG